MCGDYTIAVRHNISYLPGNILENARRLNVNRLYGEALIKTIILLGRAEQYDVIARICPNFAYTSKQEPVLSPGLIKKAVWYLNKASQHQKLDYFALSEFFSNYIDSDKSLIMSVHSLFKDHLDELSNSLREKLEERSYQIDDTSESEEDLSENINFMAIEPSIDNTYILPTLANRNILSVSLLNKYLKLLNSLNKQDEIILLLGNLMKYLTVFNDDDNALSEINKKLIKNGLWNEISQDMLVN